MKMSATQFAYLKWIREGRPGYARKWRPQTILSCKHAGWTELKQGLVGPYLTESGRFNLAREEERRAAEQERTSR